jgi:hypothetical protein
MARGRPRPGSALKKPRNARLTSRLLAQGRGARIFPKEVKLSWFDLALLIACLIVEFS